MIKLMELVKPKPGLAVQAFHDYWRHPHGTLAIGFRKVRRYIQNHRIDSPRIGPYTLPYEGIVECWFDNLDTIEQIGSDPTFLEHFGPDEERFVDRANSIFFIVEEEVLTLPKPLSPGLYDEQWSDNNRPLSIKLLQIIETDGDRPWDDQNDAELGGRIGALRHVRSRATGSRRPFLGVRELWWPTLTRFEDGIAADPDAWAELRDRPAASFAFLAQSERLV